MFQFHVEKTSETTLFDTVKHWDLLIAGGGPAGLNAALYAKRKGLNVGVITAEIGGQLHNTSTVDNYLGFQWIEGKDLSHKFLDHINSLEIPIFKGSHIQSIKRIQQDFQLILSDGKILLTKTVLVATGGAPRMLHIPGEHKLANKGVSYCTTCDAPFFKDKHVIVAGGGNSAAEAVLDLVPWASKITVVHRSQWRADQILLDKHQSIDKLTVHLNTQILSVLGDEKMTGVHVLDKTTNQTYDIPADGLFIEIGTVPKSQWIKHLVSVNDQDEIIVDSNQMTNVPGIFAAGDVTNQPFKQIIISAAEGAKAALAITQYLNHTYKATGKYVKQ
ncbi:MAG: thioredoxin reductase [Acholeplasma sp.]|jgi:thioredoxin-disulfide reductase|nr:MAG: thioredoxin reductase [Acholeplasma sp.]